jgi:hypothetical protein
VRTSKSEQCGLRPDFVEEVCDGVDLCEWPDCNYLDYPRFDEMLGELYAIPVECDSSEFVDVCGNENEEVVDVFVRRGPEEPTRKENESHNVSHTPFRRWCSACVKARAVSHPHLMTPSSSSTEKKFAGIHLAYWFMRDGVGEEKVTVLTLKDDRTKAFDGYVVNKKGRDGDLAERVVLDIARCH